MFVDAARLLTKPASRLFTALGMQKSMDDLKFNKVAAGFLMAALIAMGGYKISEMLVPHQKLAQNAYPIDVTEQVASAAAPAPTGPEPVLALLANADVAAGQKVAKKCTACHVFEKGGQNKVGPALWNIVNAQKGQIGGYAYSEALAGFGGAWFTLGSVGRFDENMTFGRGFIGLAAMIFGRWHPLGALAAAAGGLHLL